MVDITIILRVQQLATTDIHRENYHNVLLTCHLGKDMAKINIFVQWCIERGYQVEARATLDYCDLGYAFWPHQTNNII